ncbi:hypothetical protein SeLEV6574_g03296 [Synchytrium endobioticum]|uniref:Uncharacterized protein n=1 Tax=Synchytrium endobioticum TaxID=286115 RepID=A0A507D4P2_9FUNG|nr:hypothetical protein SeLEV6574_g03296 [Synchytrium endobioticum]
MSAPGLLSYTVLAIPYIAAHLVLSFVASNTNPDASTLWPSLADDTRTRLSTELNCVGSDAHRDCLVYATNLRQQEIYVVMIWMLVCAILHVGSGITSMIVYYGIRRHCYEVEEEIYTMEDTDAGDNESSYNLNRGSNGSWISPIGYEGSLLDDEDDVEKHGYETVKL